MNEERTTMTEEQEQWLAGFWEGDGSCGNYLNKSLGLVIPKITITQKDRRVLEHIKDMLGFGNIARQTNSYNLVISSWRPRCARVFELLCRYVVGQQSVNKINSVFEEFGLSVRARQHEPTLPWIAGFFDAEGNVDWCATHDAIKAYFSQKELTILESTQELVGGTLRPANSYHHLLLNGNDLRNFVPHILKYSHHEPKRQHLLTMIYVLARDGNGVWNNWAREIIGGKLQCQNRV